jgi:RNA polymerase sigma factor (sigma-70 family)
MFARTPPSTFRSCGAIRCGKLSGVRTTDDTDATLLAAWAAGDREAGDALVRRHFDAVFRFFRSKLVRDADDLVQRTFLTCIESHRGFRDEGSFRAFVLGIARIHLLRYLQRELPRSPDPLEMSAVDIDVVTRRGSPSKVVAEREEGGFVLEAMRTLPLAVQMCLELHYWEGMRVEEIAEVVGIPAGTVKTRMHRGRAALRSALAHVMEDSTLDATQRAQVDSWLDGRRDGD